MVEIWEQFTKIYNMALAKKYQIQVSYHFSQSTRPVLSRKSYFHLITIRLAELKLTFAYLLRMKKINNVNKIGVPESCLKTKKSKLVSFFTPYTLFPVRVLQKLSSMTEITEMTLINHSYLYPTMVHLNVKPSRQQF